MKDVVNKRAMEQLKKMIDNRSTKGLPDPNLSYRAQELMADGDFLSKIKTAAKRIKVFVED